MSVWRSTHRVVGLVRRMLSPARRGIRQLERRWPDTLLQPFATTGWHRHPPLFAAVRDGLADTPEPRLLSYGCSTGEEAFTLAEIMPTAWITAIDINPRSIEIARRTARRIGARRISIECAEVPPRPEDVEPFDAIFCLSVLRHGRLESDCPDDCSAFLPFERAETHLDRLDALLRPGGYLALWGSHFRLSDTRLADQYVWIPVPGKKPQPGPFYGRDNQRLDVAFTSEFLWRKKN